MRYIIQLLTCRRSSMYLSSESTTRFKPDGKSSNRPKTRRSTSLHPPSALLKSWRALLSPKSHSASNQIVDMVWQPIQINSISKVNEPANKAKEKDNPWQREKESHAGVRMKANRLPSIAAVRVSFRINKQPKSEGDQILCLLPNLTTANSNKNHKDSISVNSSVTLLALCRFFNVKIQCLIVDKENESWWVIPILPASCQESASLPISARRTSSGPTRWTPSPATASLLTFWSMSPRSGSKLTRRRRKKNPKSRRGHASLWSLAYLACRRIWNWMQTSPSTEKPTESLKVMFPIGSRSSKTFKRPTWSQRLWERHQTKASML